MSKRLWIVGIVVSVCAIPFIAREQYSARERQEASRAHDCLALALAPAERHDCAEAALGRRDYSHWWDVLIAWPNGIETWVLIATLAGILWQADATRRAAEATKESARAAALQAEHMVASERAWLIIRSAMEDFRYESGILSFSWSVENAGKTAARITKTQCMYELVGKKGLSDLPPVPIYPDPIELNGFLIPPGGREEYSTFLREVGSGRPIERKELDADLGTQLVHERLRVYGYVRYSDAFGEVRESRFIEYFESPPRGHASRSGGFRPLIGVPSAYTQCP